MIVLFLTGCGKGSDTISDTGRITIVSADSGIYGIVTAHGDHLIPNNLGLQFEFDSLQVEFEATYVVDSAFMNSWGKTVNLIRVEKVLY